MNKKNIISILFLILPALLLLAQNTDSYTDRQNLFLMASPGAFSRGLMGYSNPAMAAANHGFNSYFFFSDLNGSFSSPKHWGLITGVPYLSFAMQHHQIDHLQMKDKFTNYKVTFAAGSPLLKFGLGYGWTRSEAPDISYDDVWSLGALLRPNRYFSLGLSGHHYQKDLWTGQSDLAMRPFGTDKVTIFGEILYQSAFNEDDYTWNAGLVVQPLTGIHLTARYYENEFISIGTSISLGNSGFLSHRISDKDGNNTQQIYGFRIGAADHNLLHKTVHKNSTYTVLKLKGRMKYQRYLLFDDETNTLNETLNTIKNAQKDPRVAGLILDLRDDFIPAELIWEIRNALNDFKSAGKKVIAYGEYFAINLYHLASSADHIIMDPQGLMALEGYTMGRTFYKEMLKNIGIGFDEIRFFKYKSAMESFAKNTMSDADKEQRQALIDGQFDLVMHDIREARNLSGKQFMNLVNHDFVFNTDQALALNLIDTTGRWTHMESIIKHLTGKKKSLIQPDQLETEILPRETWEPPAKIALVYATGICDMNTGIKARLLEKTLNHLAERSDIKGIVFRVDSPGGDGMASDIVAEALKKCKEKKPVVVSQGSVAASGGYWISMYADTILAGPNTITGSIGVIASWLWDESLGDKLGMHPDQIQAGDHADLKMMTQFPLIGLGIPYRQLSDHERSRVEILIKQMYDNFKSKVAAGRDLTVNEVETVAQGRVWTGKAGLEKGLVDEIGGLEAAIEITKTMAGIPDDKPLEIIELPFKGLINPDLFSLSPMGHKIKREPMLDYLKWVSDHAGRPMPLMPMDYQLEPNN